MQKLYYIIKKYIIHFCSLPFTAIDLPNYDKFCLWEPQKCEKGPITPLHMTADIIDVCRNNDVRQIAHKVSSKIWARVIVPINKMIWLALVNATNIFFRIHGQSYFVISDLIRGLLDAFRDHVIVFLPKLHIFPPPPWVMAQEWQHPNCVWGFCVGNRCIFQLSSLAKNNALAPTFSPH